MAMELKKEALSKSKQTSLMEDSVLEISLFFIVFTILHIIFCLTFIEITNRMYYRRIHTL